MPFQNMENWNDKPKIFLQKRSVLAVPMNEV